MKKRLGALLLALVLLLNAAVPSFAAVEPAKELPFDVEIYTEGKEVQARMNWLTGQAFARTMDYTYYLVDGQEYPVYCINPSLLGITDVKDKGEHVKYQAERISEDPVLTGIAFEGYPNKTPEQLGVADKYQAYYATKMALWCHLISDWTLESFKVNPDCADQAGAQKVLEAVRSIYTNGLTWKEIPKPQVTCVPDQSVAYAADVGGKPYVKQVFTVSSTTGIWKDGIDVSLKQPAPPGARITDLSGGDISHLEGGGKTATFQVLIPKTSAKESGTEEILLSGAVNQYAVYVAECAETSLSFLQSYLMPGNPKASFTLSAYSSWEGEPEPAKGSLRLRKQDAQTGVPLAGAMFTITGPDGSTLGTYPTDGTGTLLLPNLVTGLYTAQEVSPPAGYQLSEPTLKQVVVPPEETAELVFEDIPTGSLRVEKVSNTGTHLPGVSVSVQGPDGTHREGITQSDGSVSFSGLAPGIYIVQETQGIPGYIPDLEHQFPVTVEAGKEATLTLTNQEMPGLEITKLDQTTHQPLPKVSFRVSRDGAFVGRYETDQLGKITLKNLQPGTYVIEELATDDAHILQAAPRILELKSGDGIVSIAFYNDAKPGIHLVKADAANPSQTIPGATFEIRALDGSYGPQEHTTNAAGEIDLSQLNPGFYAVRELSCPGYVPREGEQILELKPNETAEYVFLNDKLPTLTLRKLDENGQPLPGATYEARSLLEEGKILPAQTTGPDGTLSWEGLTPGLWAVRETKAPQGYALDTEEHRIQLYAGKDGELILRNLPLPSLTLEKRDAKTGTLLSGAQFEISCTQSNPYAAGTAADPFRPLEGSPFTTGPDGTIHLEDLAPGWYRIRETQAPEGYLLPSDAETLRYLAPGTDTTVPLANMPRSGLILRKEDRDTGEALSGARFRVTRLGDQETFITEAETGPDGTARIPDLEAGTYLIEETAAPEGYQLDAPAQTVVLTETDTRTLELVFQDTAHGRFRLEKVDSETGEPLEGVAFVIVRGKDLTNSTYHLDEDANNVYVTGPDGTILLTDLEAGETLLVQEAETLPGYLLDSAIHAVRIPAGGSATLRIPNRPLGGLLLEKADAQTGQPLAGAGFTICPADGSALSFLGGTPPADGIFYTDLNGQIHLLGLTPGAYVITEVQAPPGYAQAGGSYTVVVEAVGTQTLRVENTQLGNLRLLKRDRNTGKALPGAQFAVSDAASNSLLGIYETDADGEITLLGLPDGLYLVQETSAPQGYVLDDTLHTVSVRAGETALIALQNTPQGGLILEKTDALTGALLPGAQFNLSRPDGTDLGTYETDQEGRILLQPLPPGTYLLQEISAPQGYLLDSSIRVVQVLEDAVQTVSIPNRPLGSLRLWKADATSGEHLAGARFEILDSAGLPAGPHADGIYETDAQGCVQLDNLVPGLYLVRETETPNHYMLDTTLHPVQVRSGETAEFTIANYPKGGLVLEKRDAQTGEPLAGAEFSIQRADGTPLKSGTFRTNENGQIYLPDAEPGSYYIQETKAPAGYALDPMGRLVQVHTGTAAIVTFPNMPLGRLTVYKTDSETGEPLAGAKFLLVDEAGQPAGPNPEGIYETDQEGRFTMALADGVYFLTEQQAPEGYQLEDSPQTVVLHQGETVELTLENTPEPPDIPDQPDTPDIPDTPDTPEKPDKPDKPDKPNKPDEPNPPDQPQEEEDETTLVVQKVDEETGEPLPGVEFQISGPGLDPEEHYVTGPDGRIEIPGASGTVEIQEVSPAPGYRQKENSWSVEIRPGEVTVVLGNPRERALLVLEKTAGSPCNEQGIPAGAFLAGARYQIADADTGEVLGEICTDEQGLAWMELPLGRYLVSEVEAPAGFLLDSSPMLAELKEDGSCVLLRQADVPEQSTEPQVFIRKTGNREVQPGQSLTYTISDVSASRTMDLSQFYWRDILPGDGVTLEYVHTGSWNRDLEYQASVRTNLRDYWVVQEHLSSLENHGLDLRPETLNLAEGEYVTEVRFEFGTVPAGFAMETPARVQVYVPGTKQGGDTIRNVADCGGRTRCQWWIDQSYWTTVVRTFHGPELPKTGF